MKRDVEAEELTEHLEAGYHELVPTRRHERNGLYTRNLLLPIGKMKRLEIPRDHEGEFFTEVFERYNPRPATLRRLPWRCISRATPRAR